jgi:hypothetical protein
VARSGFTGKLIATALGLGTLYLLATSFAPCGKYSLLLVNQSREAIDPLVVGLNSSRPGNEIWRGRMEPGQQRYLLFDTPIGDTSYVISGRYESRGEDFVLNYSYVTVGDDDTIVITDAGQSGFERSSYSIPCSMSDALGCLKNHLAVGGFRQVRCLMSDRSRTGWLRTVSAAAAD